MRHISSSTRKDQPDAGFADTDVQFTIPIQRQILLLSVGSESVLLSTRSDILRRAGFIVEQAATAGAALRRLMAGDFDVVVLCHSVPASERNELIRRIYEKKPSTMVIFVSDGEDKVDVDASVHCLDGPETLLQTILRQLQVARKLPQTAKPGTA